MLTGAMDELALGDPWDLATDVGPVIDAEAAGRDRRLCRRGGGGGAAAPPSAAPEAAPSSPRADLGDGIADLEREVFGPVLHVATFRRRPRRRDRRGSTPPATG
jgi:RHH-type proline utilization regulon transcriptional repressor/proline dehydrogenase/delta 1-pyrroline-5-carboxylate dehydrogenase